MDEIAKTSIPQPPETPVYTHEIFPSLKAEKHSSWQNKWSMFSMDRHLFFIQRKGRSPLWFNTSSCSRRSIVTINRLRLGHVSTNEHLHRSNIVPSNLCDLDSVLDSVQHRIFACSKIPSSIRSSLPSTLTHISPSYEHYRNMLMDMNPLALNTLIKHINKFNIQF